MRIPASENPSRGDRIPGGRNAAPKGGTLLNATPRGGSFLNAPLAGGNVGNADKQANRPYTARPANASAARSPPR